MVVPYNFIVIPCCFAHVERELTMKKLPSLFIFFWCLAGIATGVEELVLPAMAKRTEILTPHTIIFFFYSRYFHI